MKTKMIMNKLQSLKAEALRYEKLDIDEVNSILDFIRQYCRTPSEMKHFNNLKRILLIAKDDNKITELETSAIVDALNETLKFLKCQYATELFITCLAGLLIIGGIAAYVILTI